MNYLYKIHYDTIEKEEIVTKSLPNIPGVENVILGQYETGKAVFIKASAAKDAVIPYHKSENAVLLYITAGSCMLQIKEESGESECFTVNAGDILLYDPPMKLHGYEAGAEGMEYFCVSLVP